MSVYIGPTPREKAVAEGRVDAAREADLQMERAIRSVKGKGEYLADIVDAIDANTKVLAELVDVVRRKVV